MIKKTKDYEQFILRNDNRAQIDSAHVKKLMESIKSKNMLELRPILVNEKMEVIDGQHRLKAAQQLGVEIFYTMQKNLSAEDIIKVNIAKSWGSHDYLNFYCEHKYPDYLKLRDFMKKHDLKIQVVMNIAMGTSRQDHDAFRKGTFKFHADVYDTELSICWETIDYIKRYNGYSAYTRSCRFWKALLKLVKHPFFDEKKWRMNFTRMVKDFAPMAREQDYVYMLQQIYNYNCRNKIELEE